MAEESKDFPSLVDVQDNCFLSPDSMCESIRTWCEAHSLKVPQTLGEIASVVYRSLAACYAQTAKELETLNGKPYPVVQVVGGGSQAEYLNQLTADALGKTVYAGPTEASAIGNIIVQMWGRGGIGSLDEARQIVGAFYGYTASAIDVGHHAADVVRAEGVERIVLGLPKNMDGTEGPRAEKSRMVAQRLTDATGLEVVLWDERRSSIEAHSILHANGRKEKKHRQTVDAVAASLILEGYLGTLR